MSDDVDQAASEPLRIETDPQAQVDESLPDGGLPPVLGVRNYQVFRATRDRPDLAEGKGYTFSHHVDLCCWRGRLYVAWNSCQKDEDTWPSRELYSTSTDGMQWSPPRDLFPQGVSTPLRMYFYHSTNGRMLVQGGLRTSQGLIDEESKWPLVVRQVGTDHELGPIYLLRPPKTASAVALPPVYSQSNDEGFARACGELLDNRPFLEQQDYGVLLGPRRMKWHEASSWPGGQLAWANHPFWVFGKGMALFHRRDGALVGISKMGFVTVSEDEGQTWSQPVVPTTLVIGSAKCWPSRTSDGRYALVYNPSRTHRYPLAVATGDDGVSFDRLGIVHGEVPVRRYLGGAKSLGPQYVRGLSEWSCDYSWTDQALWVVYSVNKEDVWVSRIPVPIRTVDGIGPDDATAWNVYSPRWAPVTITPSDRPGRIPDIRLQDRDPHDYARASLAFPPCAKAMVSFDLTVQDPTSGVLEIELLGCAGHLRPVRVALGSDGMIRAHTGGKVRELCPYPPGRRLAIRIQADVKAGVFSIFMAGRCVLEKGAFAEPVESLRQLCFRTGPYRAIGEEKPVGPGSDAPCGEAVYDVQNVRVEL